MTATFYLQQLTSTFEDHQVGEEYSASRLLMTIEQGKTTVADSPKAKATASTLHISKTQAPRKFQYRRQVQCQICRTFGHDVDEDVCRVGAQVYFAIQYQQNATMDVEKNASAYNLANNKSTINVVCQEADMDEMAVAKVERLALDLVTGKDD